MICANCQTAASQNAAFCSGCGNSLKANDAATTPDKNELWNPGAAALWSILLTPLFGSYLHMLNWRSLGEREKAAKSENFFYAALVVFITVSVLSMAMPDSEFVETISRSSGFGLLGAWYVSLGRDQSKYVRENVGSDYLRKPMIKAVFIGLAAVIGYVTMISVAGMSLTR